MYHQTQIPHNNMPPYVNRPYRLYEEHYEGIRVMIRHFVKKRAEMNGKENHHDAYYYFKMVAKLSKIKDGQFYGDKEKHFLNNCRDLYIMDTHYQFKDVKAHKVSWKNV